MTNRFIICTGIVLLVLAENHPPSVKIVAPAAAPTGNTVFNAGTPVSYQISVADKEDGDSKFDEINPKEVLLEVRWLGGKAAASAGKGGANDAKGVADDAPGLGVIMSSNCLNCHNFNGKAIGPSFFDISKRYAAVKAGTDTLTRRIKDGSSGIWGKEKMPSHPELSAAEIKNSVSWILKNAAAPGVTYYNGTAGILQFPRKGSYMLTASYTDHGIKGAAEKRLKGFDRVVVEVGGLYSQEALKADLRFVHKNLEKMHPGLYRYMARPTLDRFFDSLDHVIAGPMSAQEFFSLLTLLQGKIRNGHTMFLPGDSAMARLNRSGRLLPLSVNFAEGKLFIVENYSADSTIQPGTEILSINGKTVSSVMEQLLVRQTRDGYNQTYPVWILNHYFAPHYSFVFGEPAEFSLDLKDATGEPYMKRVRALTRDSIRYFRQARYAARYPAVNEGRGIVFQEEKEKDAAVLTIRTFDPDLLQSLYRQDYKRVFDSVFTQMSRRPIRALILDLRDNQGGDFPPGRTLLSYLLLHPGGFLLDGREARIIQPNAKHFSGALFVLMNGGSFSNTAIVCACLKRDQRAVFIGEETGGNPHIISGDPVELVLPQTKIKAEISTVTYRIVADSNDGHGILPDYPLQPTITEILAGKDPVKALALKLISQR
jgi:cytochrome c551/c552